MLLVLRPRKGDGDLVGVFGLGPLLVSIGRKSFLYITQEKALKEIKQGP
jgi:hypothetical protein